MKNSVVITHRTEIPGIHRREMELFGNLQPRKPGLVHRTLDVHLQIRLVVFPFTFAEVVVV